MKMSHILFALSVSMIAAFSGCGGSGAPLPAQQKVAKVTFLARTTAAINLKGANDLISDYTVSGFTVPSGLSVPIITGQKIIQDGYLMPSPTSSLPMFGSYSAILTGGKVIFSAGPTTSDLGFGPFADLYLIMSDQSQSKGTITSLIKAANPTMTALAGISTCVPNTTCVIGTPISVFYNISVSVQTR